MQQPELSRILLQQDHEGLSKVEGVVSFEDSADLAHPDIVLEVDSKAFDPGIELFSAESYSHLGRYPVNFFAIGLELDEIFEEYSEKVRANIPCLLLPALFLRLCCLLIQ